MRELALAHVLTVRIVVQRSRAKRRELRVCAAATLPYGGLAHDLTCFLCSPQEREMARVLASSHGDDGAGDGADGMDARCHGAAATSGARRCSGVRV